MPAEKTTSWWAAFAQTPGDAEDAALPLLNLVHHVYAPFTFCSLPPGMGYDIFIAGDQIRKVFKLPLFRPSFISSIF